MIPRANSPILDVIRFIYREEPADWTSEDYQVVQHVLEQYPKSLSIRRALVMDMLKRRFLHRSVLDVVG